MQAKFNNWLGKIFVALFLRFSRSIEKKRRFHGPSNFTGRTNYGDLNASDRGNSKIAPFSKEKMTRTEFIIFLNDRRIDRSIRTC